MKNKYLNIINMLEKFGTEPELFDLADYKTITNNFRLIRNRIYELFSITECDQNNLELDTKLFKIIEFETFLHHSSKLYRNKRKSIINKLYLTPAFTSFDEVEAFFYHIFLIKPLNLIKKNILSTIKQN